MFGFFKKCQSLASIANVSKLAISISLKTSHAWLDLLLSSDSNAIPTRNHLFHKRTLTHLAKLAKYLVWLNDWVFACKLSGCGFDSRRWHLSFRCCVCFEQDVPWHSGNYRVEIHSETRTWHDNNIQSILINLNTEKKNQRLR